MVQRIIVTVLVALALIKATNSTPIFQAFANHSPGPNSTFYKLFSGSSERQFKPSSFLDNFPTYDEAVAWMRTLQQKYPDWVGLENVGKTAEGRRLEVIIVNNALSWKTVFLVANQHGHEWGSAMAALYVIDQLVNNPDAYKNLDYRFVILPIANPDGYEYSRAQSRVWRKNRSNQAGGQKGVDINRNFSYKWDKVSNDATTDPSEDSYRGPKPFSEIESKFIKRVLVVLKDYLVLYVDLHSPGNNIVFPWSFSTRKPRDEAKLQAIADAGAAAVKQEAGAEFKVGTVAEIQGTTGGTSLDYCYAIDVNGCIGMEVGSEIEIEKYEIFQLGREVTAALAAMSLKANEYKTVFPMYTPNSTDSLFV
ncbi:AGAP008070-PA-like protein [Anopheles sinensis]|uniref:AGAP008070-PA-like protein n=1 Tax=Anopheles sinensis TaxID=74873 RepID=A0A084VN97_ANOSI|nr:AGAP008070-PA-like protein [Anopheles sinensis]